MRRHKMIGVATAAAICALTFNGLSPAVASTDEPDAVANAVSSAAPESLDSLVVEHAGDQLSADFPDGGAVTLGVDPAAGLSFTNDKAEPGASLSLPGASNLEDAVVSDDGSVTFVGNVVVPSVNVMTAADAVRVSTVIATAAQTENFDYDFGADSTVEIQDDGSALVLRSTDTSDGPTIDVILAQVAAPWAIDADGKAVATHYVANGGVLTQVVQHRSSDVTYPVVADPKFDNPNVLQSRVRFNRAETQTIADQGIFAFGGAICGPLAAACIAAAGVLAVQASLASNSSPKRCVQVTVTSATIVVGVPPVFWVDSYACK